MKSSKKILATIAIVAFILGVIVGAGYIYVSDYYRADYEAVNAFASGSEVEVEVLFDGAVAYGNRSAEYGFIFYPGGKVEYTAYEPLMRSLASLGVLCVLVEMPFNLAVLDMNAADGIPEMFPDISHWYIGGHSLGGSMAASYLGAHSLDFSGLVLLGSYSTENLSDKGCEVLSIYGSRDGVMNREKYEQYRSNLPNDLAEIVIEGGNHAGFGMYGEQEGDGAAEISATEQIYKTAEHIAEFIIR